MGGNIWNHVSNKGLISGIYREVLKSITPNNPIGKQAMVLNRHLSKGDMQMNHEHN